MLLDHTQQVSREIIGSEVFLNGIKVLTPSTLVNLSACSREKLRILGKQLSTISSLYIFSELKLQTAH